MRQIVLDTETTGLEVSQNHRIIEIGCVELLHRRTTDQNFHQFLNPEREIEEGALQVHGITQQFLADKPKFNEVADDLIKFLNGSELIIHNASFDIGFINAELQKAKHDVTDICECCQVIDSLELARKLHPGQKNSLDALCKRYEIDNSHRELHGALLDAQILADVYLAMTGGQADLTLANTVQKSEFTLDTSRSTETSRTEFKVVYANEEENAAHELFLSTIEKETEADCVWRREKTD